MPKRLFIGLELPQSCRQTLAGLDPGIKGLRWLPPGQMHLTLSFLGDVGTADEEALLRELASVRVGSFFLPSRASASLAVHVRASSGPASVTDIPTSSPCTSTSRMP